MAKMYILHYVYLTTIKQSVDALNYLRSYKSTVQGRSHKQLTRVFTEK